jgi:ATP-binding cassette, subfamily B, bacterial
MGMTAMMGSMRSLMQDASVVKQKVKPGTAKRMMRFAIPYTGHLALFLVVVLVDAGIGIVNPLIYREIINNGFLKGDGALIIRYAVLAGILGLADGALGLALSYLSATVGARVVLALRTKLFEHIEQMPLAFFTRVRTGALVSRLNTDVAGAQGAFTDILSNLVGNTVVLVGLLAAMFALSWQMTLAALVLVPFFVFPARFWGRKLQQIVRESMTLNSAMSGLMTERFNVAGAYVAKIFGRPQEDSKEFEAQAGRVSAIGVKTAIYGRLFGSAIMLMTVIATSFAYGWGGVLTVQHRLDLGTVVAFLSYLSRLYVTFTGLSNIQVTVMTALVSFERVFEVLDLAPMIQDAPDAVPVPSGPARISFDHVSFHYPTPAEVSLASLESIAELDTRRDKAVLHDITFSAEPGQLVALVGPSGAGKTTITHLVARLYDVQSGSVEINGIDVRKAKLDSLQRRVGTVMQDAHLFHDTIRANLLYAQPQATEAELTEALRAAQILPLISSLPKGLDTLCGDRGYRFSGGEKQRLAIARLLLKAPDIVILDEATAHLDSESEAAIQKAFEVALRGRTSIVIAHRLSTIVKADQILVVNEGRIVERGTHAELLERGSVYAELYRRQFADSGKSTAAADGK